MDVFDFPKEQYHTFMTAIEEYDATYDAHLVKMVELSSTHFVVRKNPFFFSKAAFLGVGMSDSPMNIGQPANQRAAEAITRIEARPSS